MHHSPQRIEIITSFYKHPLEILLNGVLSSAILYVILGLSTAAATQAVLLTGLGELVYHWNVKTPYWLGFVFQRPESHCVHHQEGLHSYNYSEPSVVGHAVWHLPPTPKHSPPSAGSVRSVNFD